MNDPNAKRIAAANLKIGAGYFAQPGSLLSLSVLTVLQTPKELEKFKASNH